MSAALHAPSVSIPAGRVTLEGMLELPAPGAGVVIFSHGSGSGRHSPRNQFVAAELVRAGLGILLVDLLTPQEDTDYEARFDITLLSERLAHAVRYVAGRNHERAPAIGLFGASTGAASALRVAAAMPLTVRAVVSRGGRPDLAGTGVLERVTVPTLLVVGGEDTEVIELNRSAYERLERCERKLVLVPRATHLFEEPGTLEEVARLASGWFTRHLR